MPPNPYALPYYAPAASAQSPSYLSTALWSGPSASDANPGDVPVGGWKTEDGYEDMDDGDEDDEEEPKGGGHGGSGGVGGGEDGEKKKSTRGSRACTVCRKLKMRCVGAEEGPPCKRCKAGGHECIFEESMRGRRTNRKTDAMAKSLKKMEATLETVLKSISSSSHPLGPQTTLPLLPQFTPFIPSPSTSVSTLSAPSVPPRRHSSAEKGSPTLMLAPNDVPGVHQTGTNGVPVPGLGESMAGGQTTGKGKGRRMGSPRLHSLPDNTLNPLGLLAEASLQNHNHRKRAPPVSLTDVLEASNGDIDVGDDTDGSGGRESKRARLGVANARYFQPGPMNNLPLRRIVIEHRMPPELLVEKIVTPAEVVELFSIFFDKCHQACPILDPEIHTPTATGSRSPFLFTCICSVAARYYTKRTDDLYRKCLRIAKRVAFDVMTKGFKSTEICQGFLLLCQWNQPAERFEEERTYQFSGIAVRMATDLNLHRKTSAVMPDDVSDETRALYEREIQNRERTWMYSFIADRSVSNQMGKPYSIPKEDFIIRSAKTWYRQPGAQKTDVGIAAMVEMHRIVGRIIDTLYSDTKSVSGLNVNLDYPLLMRSFLAQLDQWHADWSIAFPNDPDDALDGVRSHMRDFYHSYYRLFLLSFAIQHALDTPEAAIDLPRYCVLCFEASQIIIATARDFLGPQGHLRYGIDSSFVFLSYACCFLLKLVNPTFKNMVETEKAMKLVEDGANTLASVAVDETHTPALYASFLRTLIDNKRNGGRTAPNSRTGTQPSSPVNPPLDAFLKPSRQASVTPGEGLFSWTGEMGPGTGDPGYLTGADFTTFDSLAMDSMLSTGGFWENMLMPGFGGPLQGLSGGTGTMLGNPSDPWSITPLHSRPASPNGMQNLQSFDFGQP